MTFYATIIDDAHRERVLKVLKKRNIEASVDGDFVTIEVAPPRTKEMTALIAGQAKKKLREKTSKEKKA